MMEFSQKVLRHLVFGIPYGLICVRLLVAPAAATEASSYADVLSALQSGKAATVISDFSHCTNTETGQAGPAVLGGLRIQAFLVIPEKGILFSDVHHTLDASDQPVTEYIRYNLKPDGEMTLKLRAKPPLE